MGRDVIRFRCHHCNHCCTDVVCLPTPWDVVRIVKATGANPYEFLEFLMPDAITGVSKNDPTWLACGAEKYIIALRRGPNGCHFLDKRTRFCSIYESRPILCRLYPFKLRENRRNEFQGFSVHLDVGCPRHQDGIVPVKPLHELYIEDCGHQEDYEDLVQVFNARQIDGKKPEDFIDMFVSGFQRPSQRDASEAMLPQAASG